MDEGHETSGGNCLFSSIPTNLRSIGGIHFFYHNQCLTLKKKDKYHIRQSRLLWIRYFPLMRPLLWLSKPHRTEGTSALVPDSILVPQGPKQRLEWDQKRHVSRSGLALLELCTVEYGIWGNVHC